MRFVIVAIMLAALSACGDKDTEQTKGSAFQQVLPGSASDAMLPYDTATSAPPLETRDYGSPDEDGGGEPGARSSGAGETQEDVAPDAEAT